MSADVAEKMAKKASNLPVEAQQKALEFFDSPEREEKSPKKSFRSKLGIFADRNLHISEEDTEEVRREAFSAYKSNRRERFSMLAGADSVKEIDLCRGWISSR